MSELPTSRFLTTYREVEQELWNRIGRPVYGDPELEVLAQGIAMDRCIQAAVREHFEQQPRQVYPDLSGPDDGESIPWLG